MASPTISEYPDLIQAQELIYNPLELKVLDLQAEKESSEYGACRFKLNMLSICFRTAKTTPTKIGQFVTLWKRTGKSPIHPFDMSDYIDLFIINVHSNNLFGQFVFPSSVLLEKNILSQNNQGGKRAVRVYPTWDNPTSPQAKKTQGWQLKYFVQISPELDNFEKLKLLYT